MKWRYFEPHHLTVWKYAVISPYFLCVSVQHRLHSRQLIATQSMLHIFTYILSRSDKQSEAVL
jgi:hypothetical protein